jgi:hypothetical protein
MPLSDVVSAQKAADAVMYSANSLVIPPSRSQAMANKALEFSRKASEAMWKHILIVLGVVLYITFVVMATMFYYPSYYACMVRAGSMWSLSNAIVQAVFMVFLVLYVVRQVVDTGADGGGGGGSSSSSSGGSLTTLVQFVKGFDDMMPYILGFCVTFLVLSHGILFFKCRDNPDCPGCTPSQATAFNTLVTTQVNKTTPELRALLEFYTDYSKSRINIALCSNYYSDAYLNIKQSTDGTAQCGVLEDSADGIPTVKVSQSNVDPSQVPGAPLLNQFYVMTSGRTCVVNNQYDSYMSPAMIRIALTGGARCLDFEVTNHATKLRSFPVVTNSRNRDNKNLQHNFVLFEDVVRTISSEWVEPHQHMHYPADPLFLRLVLDTALTQNSMDQMAYLLQYYLNEQSGAHLLPNTMSYKALAQSDTNIGNLPLAIYYGYVVIMVHSPCKAVTAQFEKSMLSELTNALCTTSSSSKSKSNTPIQTDTTGGYQVLDASYVQSILPKTTGNGASTSSVSANNQLVSSNTQALTYVETSFSPYTQANTAPGTGCFDPKKEYEMGDSMTTLLMNKLTINNSPVPGVRTGCQFIAMNFQDISEDMKTYLAMFAKSSFILKPKSLWNTNQFGKPPPPLDTCSPGESAYTNDNESLFCYQFCLAPNQKWTSSTTPKSSSPGQPTTSLKSAFQKLTPENNNTNTCIKPGYKLTPTINVSATVLETQTDGTTKDVVVSGSAFSKSSV